MSWNYRLVKRVYNKGKSYEETLIQIEEVYYDEEGNIKGYGEAPVPSGETKEDIKKVLDKLSKALDKDIIDLT